MLGTLWADVDVHRRGKLDMEEWILLLGLISQIQQGIHCIILKKYLV